jgi:hypothetical protein
VQFLLEMYFVTTNIYRVTFEKDAEEPVRLPVKCSLLLPDFCPKSQRFDEFNKTPQFQITLNFFQRFSNCHMRTDGRTGTHAGANKHFFLNFVLETRQKSMFEQINVFLFSYFRTRANNSHMKR